MKLLGGIHLKELIKFLVRAKINTYASEGEGGEKVLEDGSKELIYSEGDFRYRDRYFGFSSFIGEEVVWENDAIIWGMNYYGQIVSEAVGVKELYLFLQGALRRVNEELPFRGPERVMRGDFEYVNEVNGDVKEFTGLEKILFQGKEVFRLVYHGGLVKKS